MSERSANICPSGNHIGTTLSIEGGSLRAGDRLRVICPRPRMARPPFDVSARASSIWKWTGKCWSAARGRRVSHRYIAATVPVQAGPWHALRPAMSSGPEPVVKGQ